MHNLERVKRSQERVGRLIERDVEIAVEAHSDASMERFMQRVERLIDAHDKQ